MKHRSLYSIKNFPQERIPSRMVQDKMMSSLVEEMKQLRKEQKEMKERMNAMEKKYIALDKKHKEVLISLEKKHKKRMDAVETNNKDLKKELEQLRKKVQDLEKTAQGKNHEEEENVKSETTRLMMRAEEKDQNEEQRQKNRAKMDKPEEVVGEATKDKKKDQFDDPMTVLRIADKKLMEQERDKKAKEGKQDEKKNVETGRKNNGETKDKETKAESKKDAVTMEKGKNLNLVPRCFDAKKATLDIAEGKLANKHELPIFNEEDAPSQWNESDGEGPSAKKTRRPYYRSDMAVKLRKRACNQIQCEEAPGKQNRLSRTTGQIVFDRVSISVSIFIYTNFIISIFEISVLLYLIFLCIDFSI